MSDFAGNVLGTNENPVVTASMGNFFVASEDHGNEHIWKKHLLAWGIGIFLVILGIVLVLWITVNDTVPPEFDSLKELVGTPYAQASLPAEEVEYMKVPFSLSLTQWQDLTDGFIYTRITEPERLTVELVLICEALLEEFGDASDFDTCSLTVLDFSVLADSVTADVPFSARWSWDLTEKEKIELETFTDREDWSGRVAGYLIDDARFYLDMTVNTDPVAQSATLTLAFRVDTKK